MANPLIEDPKALQGGIEGDLLADQEAESQVLSQIEQMLDGGLDDTEESEQSDLERLIQPLDEDEVKSIVQDEIANAIGGMGDEVTAQRRKALQYYQGKPFGNEQEGRSSVVLTDVADTIEWILPSLMRIFLGSRDVARFLPNQQEDEPMADQATEVINHYFRERMGGFMVLHDWFKTALLEKNGIVRAYFEEKIEPQEESYRGLDQQQVEMLLGDESVEPTQFSESEEQGLFDIRFVRRKKEGKLKVDGVPPEEFLMARRSATLDDCTPFCAQHKKVTISDLLAMGYDEGKVLDLPMDDSQEFSEGRTERLGDESSFPLNTAERADYASREVWLTHCYIRIDEDGDGFSEGRLITVAGSDQVEILDDQPINHNPFSSITPVPMPYKFFGLSIADLVMDLQLIRSTLLRQMLDNLYLINNARTVVEDGAVEIDDLLKVTPGGVIRAEHVDAVKPMVTAPFPPMAFDMLEYLETVKENRTGITKYNQGLDADSLNQTATGITKIMDAAHTRIELVARIFSETGLKDLFVKLLKLFTQNPMKEETVRLRGKWVTYDPRNWNAEMDVEVEVGLGVGQANERIQQLQMILQLYQQLQQAGMGGQLVTEDHVYKTLTKLISAMGFKIPEDFFADPSQNQPEPARPDPKLEEVRADAEVKSEELQLKKGELELKAQELAFDREKLDRELALKRELELERISSNERIAMHECENEIKKVELSNREKPRQAEGGSGI